VLCGSSRARLRTALDDGDSGSRPSPPRPRPCGSVGDTICWRESVRFRLNFDHFPGKTDQTDDRWSEWCYSVLVHHGGHGGRGQSFGGGGGGGLPSLFGSFFFPRSPWSLFLGAPPFALPPRKIPSFPSKMSASDVGPAGWAPLGRGGGGGRVPGDAGGVMPEPTGGLGASSDAGSRRGSLLGGGGGGCELSSASPASVSLALIPPSAAILDGERGWCVSRPARSGFGFLLFFLLCRFSG